MRYDFSAQFLKVVPPDTTFGDAWASLCFELLRAELGPSSMLRLKAPDRGVDLLCRSSKCAYQCKADERGAFGSLSAQSSIDSVTTAVRHRGGLGWRKYTFCTNADYTGVALGQLNQAAATVGLDASDVEFRGPDYWDDLCTKHSGRIADRFDYRVSVDEKRVIDALKSAGYFDKYVQQYSESIRKAKFRITIENNRTPIELELPFAPELTVETCVDVVQQLLGISLDWTNFPDLGTSAGPSLSLTINKVAQDFNKRIADLTVGRGDKLELWVKILWKDEVRKEGRDGRRFFFMHSIAMPELTRTHVSPQGRETITCDRAEKVVQAMMWTATAELGR